MVRHVAKFCGIIFFNPKVMGANKLNFKPNLTPHCKKIVRAIPGGVCASKLWSFCSACKNFMAQRPIGAVETWCSEKVDLTVKH